MHIDRILLRDVGPFDDVTIEFPKGTDPNLADVYLLTGPNGSGKSTVLYALASLIDRGSILGEDLLRDRQRSQESLVAFSSGGSTFARQPQHRPSLPNPFEGNPEVLSQDGRYYGYYVNARDDYWETILASRNTGGRGLFSWAAFAYAGLRSVSDAKVVAIKPPSIDPLHSSLSFATPPETGDLVNWIAYQDFRRLKAREAGDHERANNLAETIESIERAIGEIVEDSDFKFLISDEVSDIRVRWRGTTVRLELLPDGLKSIVSWVADLLMRLDRVPWQNNTPILRRPFLLLLDEIDIHLHPAWQRRVLPLVQRMFPNAQIIASTHSPFVVGSLGDGRIITLGLRGSSAFVKDVSEPQLGVSYPAVLRSIFGIDSEFDVDTEQLLAKFRAAKQRLLRGEEAARNEVDQIAKELAERSEELRELIALEMGQLRRQIAVRAAP